MKVTIDREGQLIIKPENELEGYALSRWAAENLQCKCLEVATVKILIYTLTGEEEAQEARLSKL